MILLWYFNSNYRGRFSILCKTLETLEIERRDTSLNLKTEKRTGYNSRRWLYWFQQMLNVFDLHAQIWWQYCRGSKSNITVVICMHSAADLPHACHAFTCIHLPNVDGAIRASHHQVVVCWTPLDDLDREEVPWRQHDALPLPEAEQADGVVAGHRADAVLHPSLQRKHRG